MVFVGFGSDLAGAGDCGGEDEVAPLLQSDVHEDDIAGHHPVHESFVSIGHSLTLPLIEDLCLTIAFCPARHISVGRSKIPEGIATYYKRFVRDSWPGSFFLQIEIESGANSMRKNSDRPFPVSLCSSKHSCPRGSRSFYGSNIVSLPLPSPTPGNLPRGSAPPIRGSSLAWMPVY